MESRIDYHRSGDVGHLWWGGGEGGGSCRCCRRREAFALHEGQHLARNLRQHLRRQLFFAPGPVLLNKLAHLHELDNVPLGHEGAVPQQRLVTVKLLHRLEILISHPHNYDGQRQRGGFNDSALGLVKVRDDAVCDDEENEIVGGVILVGVGKLGHVSYDGGEVGGSVQLDIVESVVVGGHDALQPGAEGRGGVEAEEELVGHCAVGRHPGPEPEGGEHLVAVVVLDDVAHGRDGGLVLVGPPAGVAVVEAAGVRGVAVGACEVHRQGEVDLSAAADKVEEGGESFQTNTFQNDDTGVLIFGPFLLLPLLVDDIVLIVLAGALLQIVNICVEAPNNLVRPTAVPIENIKFQVPEVVSVTQGSYWDLEWCPSRV